MIAARSEDQVDLVMRGQKPLSLPVGLEASNYFLLFARRPVRHFDRVVQTIVGAMIHIRRQFTDGLDVTAQLVGDYDP